MKLYSNETSLDFNLIAETLMSGYRDNPIKSMLFSILNKNGFISPYYVLDTLFDPNCDLNPETRKQLLVALLEHLKHQLQLYHCYQHPASIISLRDPELVKILLSAHRSNGQPLFNANIRPEISGTTVFEEAVKALMESSTTEQVRTMRAIIRLLKQYGGTYYDSLQYQCDSLFFIRLRDQLSETYSTVQNVLHDTLDTNSYLDYFILKDELGSKLGNLEKITRDITYLERYAVTDISLLHKLNEARRLILTLNAQIPIAIQNLDWRRCRSSYDRCTYPQPLVTIPKVMVEQMLAFNTFLLRNGILGGVLGPYDVIQVMGPEYKNKGRTYLQNLANAITRLKTDGLLFNQEIYELITGQLNAAYSSGISTDNPRALAEMISVIKQIKREDGSSFLDSPRYINLIKQTAQFNTDVHTLGPYPLSDLCFMATILQKLASLQMISEDNYIFDFSIRGTIDLLLDWLREDKWQDPGHLLKALNTLEAEGLLNNASFPVFLRGITPTRSLRVSSEYRRNILVAFNGTELARFEAHIAEYIKEESRKMVSSSWYARRYTNTNETVCYGDVQYIPVSPPSPINFQDMLKGPSIPIQNKTDSIQSAHNITYLPTVSSTAIKAASYGIVRGTSTVIAHHINKRFSPWVAYACGQITYAAGLFSLNVKSQYDKSPDQNWEQIYPTALSETAQQLVIHNTVQCLEHLGQALEKRNHTTIGKSLKAASSLASFGLFAHSTINSPILTTTAVVAGSKAQAAVEYVGLW